MMRITLTALFFLMTVERFQCFQQIEDTNYLNRYLKFADDNFLKSCEEQARVFKETGRHIEIASSLLLLIYSIIGKTGHSPKSLELARQMNKLQDEIPFHTSFPCLTNNTRSKKKPKKVNRVRPGDIDVIAALGDSLIAANGAVSTNVFQVFIANRGVSWAIGGQENWRKYLTLPNILKEFNPKLIGYSTGDSLYSANRERSQLNAAEPGARSQDLPAMANTLIKRIKAHPQIDLQKDWKMVTIFIGAMDFCFGMCYRENPEEIVEEHRQNLLKTLLKLKKHLPRTIVNVVQQINLANIIPKFSGLPWLCKSIYKPYECPCLADKKFKNFTLNFASIMSKWQQIESEVVNNPKLRNQKDFVAIVQPFLVNTEFPTVSTDNGLQTDLRYLSHDCFHLSQLGHAKAANALWNNIMEPPGRKSTTWESDFLKLKCPTEDHPYIPVR